MIVTKAKIQPTKFHPLWQLRTTTAERCDEDAVSGCVLVHYRKTNLHGMLISPMQVLNMGEREMRAGRHTKGTAVLKSALIKAGQEDQFGALDRGQIASLDKH